MGLKIAAHPVQHALAWRADGHFDAVVQAGQTDTAFHHGVEFLDVGIDEVAVASGTGKHHRVGVFEGGLGILRPNQMVLEAHLVFTIGFRQPFPDQLTASGILVLAVSVGTEVRDEYDFLGGGSRQCRTD